MTDTQIEEISKTYTYWMMQLGHLTEECWNLPIVIPAANVPDVTAERLIALNHWPAWHQLTSRRGGERSTWYRSQPECAGSTRLVPCDEFPWNRTREGGNPGATKRRPHLKLLDQTQNSSEGGSFNAFLSNNGCDLPAGTAFLAMPTLSAPTTTRLCNAG